MSTVSETTRRNQRLLLSAAERLLSGQARNSDGKLTLKTLAEEAGVPRPYLYRPDYKGIAAEFESQAAALRLRSETPDARLAQLEAQKVKTQKFKERAKRYRRSWEEAKENLRLAASQIAFLTEQNRVLREKLEKAQGVPNLDDRR